MEYTWFMVTIVFIIGELLIPGLVVIWFAAAGFCTMIFSYFNSNQNQQIYFFIVLSALFLGLVRKTAKKYLKTKENEKLERVAGKKVIIKGIDSRGNYEVYIDGKHWIGKSDENLKVGDECTIKGIEGIKLILEKTEK